MKQLNPQYGDLLHVIIYHNQAKIFEGNAPYSQTFGAVAKGMPVSYLNSLMQLSFALNQDSFAKLYKIESGNNWNVEVTVLSKK